MGCSCSCSTTPSDNDCDSRRSSGEQQLNPLAVLDQEENVVFTNVVTNNVSSTESTVSNTLPVADGSRHHDGTTAATVAQATTNGDLISLASLLSDDASSAGKRNSDTVTIPAKQRRQRNVERQTSPVSAQHQHSSDRGSEPSPFTGSQDTFTPPQLASVSSQQNPRNSATISCGSNDFDLVTFRPQQDHTEEGARRHPREDEGDGTVVEDPTLFPSHLPSCTGTFATTVDTEHCCSLLELPSGADNQ